jgi:hypothetical protein
MFQNILNDFMIIETKFNKGEAVWVMYYNKPRQVRIDGIAFAIGSVNPSLSEIPEIETKSKDVLMLSTPKLVYTISFPTAMSDYSGNYFHERYTEDKLFSTRDELIKSL